MQLHQWCIFVSGVCRLTNSQTDNLFAENKGFSSLAFESVVSTLVWTSYRSTLSRRLRSFVYPPRDEELIIVQIVKNVENCEYPRICVYVFRQQIELWFLIVLDALVAVY